MQQEVVRVFGCLVTEICWIREEKFLIVDGRNNPPLYTIPYSFVV